MAKKREEGIYVEKPRADVYMVLLILTFLSIMLATVLMWFEYSTLS